MDREERQRIARELASGKFFSRTEEKVDGRAHEPYMKKQIIDRVYEVWSAHPDMRFGQLIANLFHGRDLASLHYKEDFPLVEDLEEFYEHHKTL